jgi:hypothetical protein
VALTVSAIVNIQLSYIQSACSLIVLAKLSEANIALEILCVRYLRYADSEGTKPNRVDSASPSLSRDDSIFVRPLSCPLLYQL